MTMTVLYTAHATVHGGREGKAETDDKKLSVTLTKPGGPGTNPEQLFAVGYAACFSGALSYVTGQRKLNTGEITIKSDITLNQGDGGFSIGATLNVSAPGLSEKDAIDLVREADTVCPYSKALRNNVKVTLTANGKPVN
jgi:Ohr subfamily peroxiredoxin